MNELVKTIRIKLGLNQEQFAKALSTTSVTISRWENNISLPNKMAQAKIFEFCLENNIDITDEIVDRIANQASNGAINLYHGSKSGITGEIGPLSRSTCDFGSGFYLGTDPMQPLTLICDEDDPIVYSYELDLTGLKVLKLDLNLDWALLISYFRGYMKKEDGGLIFDKFSKMCDGYDVVVGYIADDRMYRVMKMFFEKTITDAALINSLSALDLGMQYVCKTKKACEHLKLIKKRELSSLELSFLRTKSEARRNDAVSKTDKIIESYRRVGNYYDEIVGGKV